MNVDSTLPVLVSLLKQVELSDEISVGELYEGTHYLTNGAPADLPMLLRDIVCLADHLLIDNEGRCDYNAHAYLRGFGFYVTPGEQDSFGWLTGCIHTKKGVIVYG